MDRGFILQPTYRIEAGRAVVHLHGRLETGAPFLVRDNRQVPHFYVRGNDASRVPALGMRVTPCRPERVDFRGDPVARVEVALPGDVPAARDRLRGAGIPCFEADVGFANRYLIDRGIRGSLEIRGRARSGGDRTAVFENPEVAPTDWQPELSVLSLDIETDPSATRLLSVALHGRGVQEVLLLTPAGYSCPASAIALPDERALLRAFVRRVRELDPDVLTGWNVVDFDLAVLERLGKRWGVPLAIGRGAEPMRILPAPFPRGSSRALLTGRVVLDGIGLLRDAFVKMESYALQAVSVEILGRGKTITGSDRGEKILETFEKDRAGFVAYNLNDARLVTEILDRLHLVELSVQRSRLTGMPPDRVAASIASFDFLYLSALHRRRVVAPTLSEAASSTGPTSGGHVLEPRPGLHRNVLVLDFKSLYPSIIRTFQIDPLGHLPAAGPDDDAIVAPNGAAFRRRPGILPEMLDDLFPRREAARAAGDRVASQAIKILMNSFYGVLGTSACRFASPALANAITGFGREILLWSKARIEQSGHDVLYGDTDSLFVLSGSSDADEAHDLGTTLVAELNRQLSEHVATTWRVTSHLEMEFEQLYLRLLLPAVRHGKAGARKRYAGLVATAEGERVVFTGLEVVRRDWTGLARRTQRELYEKLFTDQPVDAFLRRVVADLRAGRLDEQLIYRKALRKRLDEYTASTPPHVAAARKMRGKPGRRMSYVMTRNGPEPAAEQASPIDHEHYVQRQIRPVAEPVLLLLGLDFDRVVGDDAQLRLF